MPYSTRTWFAGTGPEADSDPRSCGSPECLSFDKPHIEDAVQPLITGERQVDNHSSRRDRGPEARPDGCAPEHMKKAPADAPAEAEPGTPLKEGPRMSSISLIANLSRPAAPYVQIADHYRELIATGNLQPGDRLPTVIQMAAAWKVSPGTAHKAVRRLRSEGLVRTTRQGTTVQGEEAA